VKFTPLLNLSRQLPLRSSMQAKDFKEKFLKGEYQNRFMVMAFLGDQKWLEIYPDEPVPTHTLVGFRMKADLDSWSEYEGTNEPV